MKVQSPACCVLAFAFACAGAALARLPLGVALLCCSLAVLLRLCVCKTIVPVRVSAASCLRGSPVSLYCPVSASCFWRGAFSCVLSPRSCSCSLKVEPARPRVSLRPRPARVAFSPRRVFALPPLKKNFVLSPLRRAPFFFASRALRARRPRCFPPSSPSVSKGYLCSAPALGPRTAPNFNCLGRKTTGDRSPVVSGACAARAFAFLI